MKPFYPPKAPVNLALKRVISESQNPYHALHIEKAYELHSPKLKPISGQDLSPSVGNPWAALGVKK
jgi:hypothetical protein